MSRPAVLTWYPAAVDSIALLQDLGAAGPLVLNGPRAVFKNNSRQVTLTSANNLSAVNFTVVGLNEYGIATTEVIAGPNANTVTTVAMFSSVTSITGNAAALQISIGLATSGILGTYLYNYHATNPNLGVQVIVTGVINYSLFFSMNPKETIYDAVFTPVGAMTGATTSQMATTTQPTRYAYIKINSSNLGGAIVATLIQQGID